MITKELDTITDEELFESISHQIEQLSADEDYPVTEPDKSHADGTVSCDPASETVNLSGQHQHASLKNSVPTRWNNTLEMIESILDL